MEFSANNVNGKLVVELVSVKNAVVHAFMMPKTFNSKFGYHGLFENGYIEENQVSGNKYEVPSDWVVVLSYHIGYFGGNILAATWVEDYADADIPKI